MKRRGFFGRIAALVAAVAISPEIAFRKRLELPAVSEPSPQHYSVVVQGVAVEFYVFNEALSDKACQEWEKLLIKKYVL